MRVGLPLVLSLLWALVCLVIVPYLYEIPLSNLATDDSGLVVFISGAIALIWGILRAALAYVVLRTPSAPKVVAAPARV